MKRLITSGQDRCVPLLLENFFPCGGGSRAEAGRAEIDAGWALNGWRNSYKPESKCNGWWDVMWNIDFLPQLFISSGCNVMKCSNNMMLQRHGQEGGFYSNEGNNKWWTGVRRRGTSLIWGFQHHRRGMLSVKLNSSEWKKNAFNGGRKWRNDPLHKRGERERERGWSVDPNSVIEIGIGMSSIKRTPQTTATSPFDNWPSLCIEMEHRPLFSALSVVINLESPWVTSFHWWAGRWNRRS